MIKSLVKRVAASLGYKIARIPPDDTEERYKSFPPDSLAAKRFYNFGAGYFLHKYWTNIDFSTAYYASAQKAPFINYDATTLAPFPIESDVAELFYSAQVIEHLPDEAVRNFLEEAHRCLKPGGLIRLITPCAETCYAAYKRGDLAYFHWAEEPARRSGASIHRVFLNYFASQIAEIEPRHPRSEPQCSDEEIVEVFSRLPMEDALDQFARRCTYDATYPGSHLNWWTEEKLAEFLRSAGFAKVYRSRHSQSASPPLRDLRYFDPTDQTGYSLYMEAVK